MVSENFWGRWCKNVEFSTPKPMLGSKNVRSMTPQKWGFWCQIRFLGPKNIKGGPKKWKKTVFLKKGQSYSLPKIIYGISEPHGNLLHWNWASTFNFSAHEERGVPDGFNKFFTTKDTYLHQQPIIQTLCTSKYYLSCNSLNCSMAVIILKVAVAYYRFVNCFCNWFV